MQIVIVVVHALFLSTLSLRRATEQSASYNAYLAISIHALLAESDIEVMEIGVGGPIFLSTLSLRRATQQKSGDRKADVNFYPRSPCGERQM